MRKLLASGAMLVAVVTSSLAADLRPMPSKAAPLAAAPAYNWTGFYIGAHVGYGWRDSDAGIVPNDAEAAFLLGPAALLFTPLAGSSFDADGGFGGAQVGFNWQVSPAFVLGIEADISGAGIEGTGVATNFSAIFASTGTAAFSEDLDWFGTVRARAGFLVTPRLLVYATGGLAYGHVERSATFTMSAALVAGGGPAFACLVPGTPCFSGAASRTDIGWTAGGGLEWAVTQNVSIKGEYLFARLEGDSITLTATPLGALAPSTATVTFDDFELHTARIGINYKFGGAAPVIARY